MNMRVQRILLAEACFGRLPKAPHARLAGATKADSPTRYILSDQTFGHKSLPVHQRALLLRK